MATYDLLTRDANGALTGLLDQFVTLDFAPRYMGA